LLFWREWAWKPRGDERKEIGEGKKMSQHVRNHHDGLAMTLKINKK
jgi:hypothetical protein